MKTLIRLFCLSIMLDMLSQIARAQADYTVHEWGTFTSVSGSDGVLLPGLQQEEEPLPMFVHSHAGMGWNYGKGWSRPLQNVTIKMETPVIYFYTSQPFEAHVHVGFNGGSISQWFPTRSGGEIPPPVPTNMVFREAPAAALISQKNTTAALIGMCRFSHRRRTITRRFLNRVRHRFGFIRARPIRLWCGRKTVKRRNFFLSRLGKFFPAGEIHAANG